jgi:pyruvate formate lyase activating enzyme
MAKAKIMDINRHRIESDGQGVTTLVAFHGCQLNCKYCLNPQCHYITESVREMYPYEVMNEIERDELYYIASEGGVTFGGGEPYLQSHFIKEVLELGAKRWNITIETSLNVKREHIEELIPYINEYIVDIKDMNDDIYQNYTGWSNSLMKSNLKFLVDQGCANYILCRVPLIPEYNTELDQEKNKKELMEMGITRFEMFNYLQRKQNTFWEDTIRNFSMCGFLRGIVEEE